VQSVPQNGAAVEPTITRDGGWLLGGWSVPFNNVTRNINTTADWLRLGAVATEGRGNVTSADVTWLARSVAGHIGFEISDLRIANLRGANRLPELNDVTMMARWLVGYDLDLLISQTSPE
jgi:hypothetical protein